MYNTRVTNICTSNKYHVIVGIYYISYIYVIIHIIYELPTYTMNMKKVLGKENAWPTHVQYTVSYLLSHTYVTIFVLRIGSVAFLL
jgi:hypothetical protein